MHPAVEDVEHRHGEQGGAACPEVFVERFALILRRRPGGGHAHPEHGVRAQPALVLRPVEIEHRLVDGRLVRGVEADDGRADFIVDVRDRREHALAVVAGFVAVAELERFMRARRCAGGNRGPGRDPAFQDDFDFHGGVSAGIEDLAAADPDDFG